MGSWLRTNLVPILIGLSVLMAIGTVSGWVTAAGAKGEARIHEAHADSADARADAWAADVAVLADSLVTLRDRYAVDSVRWSERTAENRAHVVSLTRQAQRTAQALRERLDSAGTALLDEYEARMDSIVATKDSRIADLESERASLWTQRETLADLVSGLEAENAALRSTNASLRAANEALARAADSGGILPDLGVFTEPLLAVGSGAIGYVLGRATR